MSDALQKWEGCVDSVEKDSFWARIKDMADLSCCYSIEIDFKALKDSEKKWLAPGALFVWYTKKDRSLIRFKHRRWTAEEIKEAEQNAKEISEMLDW